MKILGVVGARPGVVAIAPRVRAMGRRPTIISVLVHTGQHDDGADMPDGFSEALAIPAPDVNPGVGSASHDRPTAEIMQRREAVGQARHQPSDRGGAAPRRAAEGRQRDGRSTWHRT